MLNDKELKEVNKLSDELREKIIAMFSSPYYLLFQALDAQITAFANDVISQPYTIRSSGANEQSKAEFDSMLKAMDKMDSLSEMREKFRGSLTPEEQEKVNKVITASSLRQEAVGKGK